MFLLDRSNTICALDLANSIFVLYCYRTGEQQLLATDLQQKDFFTLKTFSHNAGSYTNFYFSFKIGLMFLTFFLFSMTRAGIKKYYLSLTNGKNLTSGTYIRCFYSLLLIFREL